ncbi:MAG: YkoF family thiamine/hydroxymethylpyrimidine-binding protein [Georgenia sp.]
MSIKTEEGTSIGATPEQFGVGMRFSIHPHTDDFVEVILGALADVEATGLAEGLVIEIDDVSTYVGARTAPAEQRLIAYLCAVIVAASRRSRGAHIVTHVLFSRGCPGEVSCELAVTGPPTAEPVDLDPVGIRAVAQWSLYPLLDGSSDSGDHMSHIEAAIGAATQRGITASPAHYATKLAGDLADVLAIVVDAWARVGTGVPHVVTHLSVSVGSPTSDA